MSVGKPDERLVAEAERVAVLAKGTSLEGSITHFVQDCSPAIDDNDVLHDRCVQELNNRFVIFDVNVSHGVVARFWEEGKRVAKKHLNVEPPGKATGKGKTGSARSSSVAPAEVKAEKEAEKKGMKKEKLETEGKNTQKAQDDKDEGKQKQKRTKA